MEGLTPTKRAALRDGQGPRRVTNGPRPVPRADAARPTLATGGRDRGDRRAPRGGLPGSGGQPAHVTDDPANQSQGRRPAAVVLWGALRRPGARVLPRRGPERRVRDREQ